MDPPDKRQKTKEKRQKTKDKRQKTKDKRQKTKDKKQKTKDKNKRQKKDKRLEFTAAKGEKVKFQQKAYANVRRNRGHSYSKERLHCP